MLSSCDPGPSNPTDDGGVIVANDGGVADGGQPEDGGPFLEDGGQIADGGPANDGGPVDGGDRLEPFRWIAGTWKMTGGPRHIGRTWDMSVTNWNSTEDAAIVNNSPICDYGYSRVLSLTTNSYYGTTASGACQCQNGIFDEPTSTLHFDTLCSPNPQEHWILTKQ